LVLMLDIIPIQIAPSHAILCSSEGFLTFDPRKRSTRPLGPGRPLTVVTPCPDRIKTKSGQRTMGGWKDVLLSREEYHVKRKVTLCKTVRLL
jgi:hypothetical protein